MRRSLSFCHCKACCDHLYRISRQGVQPDRRDERDEITTASWRRLMKSYSSIFSCAFGTGGLLLCVGGYTPTRSAGLGQHVAMAWSVGKIRFAFGVRLHICFNTRPDFHCPLRHRHRRAASFEPDMGLQPLNGASGHNEIHCPFWIDDGDSFGLCFSFLGVSIAPPQRSMLRRECGSRPMWAKFCVEHGPVGQEVRGQSCSTE